MTNVIKNIIDQQGLQYLKIPTALICTNPEEYYKDKPETKAILTKKELITNFSSTTHFHWSECAVLLNDKKALDGFKAEFINWLADIVKLGKPVNKYEFEYFKTNSKYMKFKIKLWYYKSTKYIIPV